MRIKELNVIEFGGLVGRRFELTDGINIFEGENESGKSTLWLFIKFMLYGMPKKGHPERERSINRMSHRAAGTMVVSSGGEDYRIERSFSENSRGRVTTVRLSDGEKVFTGEEPGEAMLSVPRDIFENSVAIGQGSCAGLGGEKGAAAIRNILSSADENVDVEKIQKKLDSLRVYYRHINGKGGKLYELSQKKNLLEERLSEAEASRLKITDTEEKLLKNDKNIENAERLLEAARGLVDNLGRREIVGRFDSLTQNEKQLSELIQERESIIDREKREGYVPLAVDGVALNAAADGYENAERKAHETEDALRALLEKPISENETELADIGARIESDGGVQGIIALAEGAKKKKTLGIVLLSLGVAAIALTAWNALIFAGLTVGVALVAVGIWLTLKGVKQGAQGILASVPKGEPLKGYVELCAEAYSRRQGYRENIADAEEKCKDSQRLLEYFKNELSRAMERVGATSQVTVENARAEAKGIEAFIKEYNGISSKIENLKATVERDKAFLSAYDEGALRKGIENVDIPNISMREAEERQRYYKESLVALRERGAVLKTELINLKARGEDPKAIGDELEAVKAEYASADKIYEAVLTAIEGIQMAAAALRGSMTPIIGKNATELIAGITDGKYKEVSVGRDLDITLIDKDELSTTTGMMSGGMRDSAYLALRISLLKSLFDREMPPVMMDETLCQLDSGRVERVLKMLDRISTDGLQLLIFTCHQRERELCSRLGIDANTIFMGGNCN